MFPAWTTFIRTLNAEEQYVRMGADELPEKETRVSGCRVCWAKEASGLHLFMDVHGGARWRVFLSKGRPNYASVPAGASVTGVRQAEGLLVLRLG